MKAVPTNLDDGVDPVAVFSLYRDANGNWFVSAEDIDGSARSWFATATYDDPREALAEAVGRMAAGGQG